MGRCRTNYGLARKAEAQNILHYPHKQLWVKKKVSHDGYTKSLFVPQLLDYYKEVQSQVKRQITKIVISSQVMKFLVMSIQT